jgi:ketosteroid isomerase-like protein
MTAAMTTLSLANSLVDMCRQGKEEQLWAEFYSPDIVSVEAGAAPGTSAESVGLAALRAKSAWWYDNHEVHSVKTTGPWPHGDRFIVGFEMDVTTKATGQRFQMEEKALYTVKDGKIVREEFFYAMGG